MPCAPMPREAWPSWTVFGIRTYHVDEVLVLSMGTQLAQTFRLIGRNHSFWHFPQSPTPARRNPVGPRATLRHRGPATHEQGDTPSFSLYHQVFNRARWSARCLIAPGFLVLPLT